MFRNRFTLTVISLELARGKSLLPHEGPPLALTHEAGPLINNNQPG